MNNARAVVITFCLVLFAAALGGATRAQNPTKEKVKVVNRTRSLEVTDVEVGPTFLFLTVRNNYQQPVRGLVVSMPRVATIMYSTPHRDKMIEPGAMSKASFPVTIGREVREVRVLVAILEDCTMDGDSGTIKKEQAELKAEKALNEKIIAELDKTLDGLSHGAADPLEKLERGLSSIADNAAREMWATGYARKVGHSRFVLARVTDLRQDRRADAKVDVREGLIAIRKLLEVKRTSC